MEELETNLDSINEPEELEKLAGIYASLADYANTKAAAVRSRLAGNINVAIHYEKVCDKIYSELPFKPW